MYGMCHLNLPFLYICNVLIYFSVVQRLLTLGVDVNACSSDNRTPIFDAVQQPNQQVSTRNNISVCGPDLQM